MNVYIESGIKGLSWYSLIVFRRHWKHSTSCGNIFNILFWVLV